MTQTHQKFPSYLQKFGLKGFQIQIIEILIQKIHSLNLSEIKKNVPCPYDGKLFLEISIEQPSQRTRYNLLIQPTGYKI